MMTVAPGVEVVRIKLFVQKNVKIQKVVNKGENYCVERTKSNKTPLNPQPLRANLNPP